MGAFGKVLQVRNKVNAKIFAMKIISKRLLKKGSSFIENTQVERSILTRVQHPFIVKCHCSFQTREKLFIIMDFLAGGELFLRLGREGIFLEKTAAFYLGEIILALDHLHSLGILHRDLKPENILLCNDGHICVTDFGLARDLSGETGFEGFQTEEDESRARTVCGTQEYMSPEMLSRKGYGRASDYWSLGCIAYEMLSGRSPFESRRGRGAKDLFRRIMTEKIKMPDGSTAAACKLLKGLLNRNATQRWGAARSTMFEVGGVAGLKAAAFFKHIDWKELELKQLEPPHSKPVDNDEDLRHFYEEFKQMPLPRSVIEMSKDTFSPKRVHNGIFRGFSFVHDDFALPIRQNSELQRYWESNDDDGESISEVASSKFNLGENTAKVEQKAEQQENPPKRKRPPRKRKKKSKGGSNQISPVSSEAGEKVPTSKVCPPVETEGVGETKSIASEKQSRNLIPRNFTPPQPSRKENIRTNTKQTAHKLVVSKSKKEVRGEVKIIDKKNSQPGINIPPWNNQHVLAQANDQRPYTVQPLQQPLSKSTLNYSPVAGSWAARAHKKSQTALSSTPQPKQRNQLLPNSVTKSFNNALVWQQSTPEVPPSPSGDWRKYSLARNLLSPPKDSIHSMSCSRSRKLRPDLSSFPELPSFDTGNFPTAGIEAEIAAAAKPKGAWATRVDKLNS